MKNVNATLVVSATSKGLKFARKHTNVGAIPSNVGFSGTGGGFVRNFTPNDTAQQSRNLAAMSGQRF